MYGLILIYRMLLSFILCLILIYFPLSISIFRGPRTLVLLENEYQIFSHSIFFSQLEARSFVVSYRLADDSSLTLSLFGEYLYDNILIMAPSTEEFGGDLSSQSIIDFIDSGRNAFICLNSKVSNVVREISLKCGVSIDESEIVATDHFNRLLVHDPMNSMMLVPTDNLIPSQKFLGFFHDGFAQSFLLYHGVSLRLNETNPLLIKVLSGFTSTYTSIPLEPIVYFPNSIGSESILISALQARNDGRVIIAGSLDFFSNERFTEAAKYSISNRNVSLNVLLWCFKSSGILRIVSFSHSMCNTRLSPSEYTVNDCVNYEIQIEELNDNIWKSFQATDVQLEFRRIDPYLRLNMNFSQYSRHHATFILPDIYGVFQFIINYSRIGFNSLFSSTQVSVRPFQHTEYERFILCAFPYYISSFSMLFGFVLFSMLFLYHLTLPKFKIN